MDFLFSKWKSSNPTFNLCANFSRIQFKIYWKYLSVCLPFRLYRNRNIWFFKRNFWEMDLPFFEPRPTPCHTWVCYCHAVSGLAGCIHWAFILKAFFEYQLGDILTAVIYCLQNHLLTFTRQKASTYAIPIEKIRKPWKKSCLHQPNSSQLKLE